MTDIDELQAGPELDALIAEAIGRGHVIRHISGWICSDTKEPLPHYSTDIAAAWEVVEELRKGAFHNREIFSLEATFEENGEAWEIVWDCVIGSSDTHKAGWGFGHTAEMAICHAALRTLREGI